MHKLISVVWRTYHIAKEHDAYGDRPNYNVDGHWYAFFDDGSSMIYQYDAETKTEKWMRNVWPSKIPVGGEDA